MSSTRVLLVLVLGFVTSLSLATPLGINRRSTTALSTTQINAFTPFIQFAAAAYCNPDTTQNWSCGEACTANPTFEPTLTGGDGDAEQFFFVGHNAADDTIIVAHEGTDPTEFLSVLTDLDIPQTTLDSSLFPGASSSALVHEGFSDEHAKTAQSILTEVKRLLGTGVGAGGVVTVGHSLGGALAELDALFMTLNLPSSVKVKSVTFGTPRVGNAAYASFFDSKVSDFTRVNHNKDPIPTVPGRDLLVFETFQHPHGEVHLLADGSAVACSGDDDEDDSDCTISTVPNIFESNILDHLGPYNGLQIGTQACN